MCQSITTVCTVCGANTINVTGQRGGGGYIPCCAGHESLFCKEVIVMMGYPSINSSGLNEHDSYMIDYLQEKGYTPMVDYF